MADATQPWWVIGGSAVALHGAGGTPGDVDVLLSEGDALTLLPRLGLSPRPGTRHPRFHSALFVRWEQAPLVVEFMAGFMLDGVPVRPRTRVGIDRAGARVFVPARDELIAMLRAIGRPKDLARADRLARG